MGREQFKSARTRALELSSRRDEISAEIEAIVSQLEAPGGPGVSGNLVDAEGFPRDDIDVHAARDRRHRLAVLKTDYKAVTKEMEAALRDALPPAEDAGDDDVGAPSAATSTSQAAPTAATAPNQGAPAGAGVTPQDRLRAPFCVVDSVAASSPASEAGILVDDRIVAFGAVSLRTAHEVRAAMQGLALAVREHEGRAADVLVHRGPRDNMQCLRLQLTPRRWSGTGLLGCHVLPAQLEEESAYRPDVATAVFER